jgi:putative acetyltransferase
MGPAAGGVAPDIRVINMHVRPEATTDIGAIRDVNNAAFETSVEADIVDALRPDSKPLISLVAEEQGRVVGHILFSKVTLVNGPDILLMGLGPMAVIPEYQRQGIGSVMVSHGLKQCGEIGARGVVVLGHPAFYPRFGFLPASQFGLRSEYDVPDDVFMAIELEPGALKDVVGTVAYADAFNDASVEP